MATGEEKSAASPLVPARRAGPDAEARERVEHLLEEEGAANPDRRPARDATTVAVGVLPLYAAYEIVSAHAAGPRTSAWCCRLPALPGGRALPRPRALVGLGPGGDERRGHGVHPRAGPGLRRPRGDADDHRLPRGRHAHRAAAGGDAAHDGVDHAGRRHRFFLLYALLGNRLPKPWTHRGYARRTCRPPLHDAGGHRRCTVDVSSSLIILFTIFGAVLQHSGAGRFIDFSFAAMGGRRNAPGAPWCCPRSCSAVRPARWRPPSRSARSPIRRCSRARATAATRRRAVEHGRPSAPSSRRPCSARPPSSSPSS